MKEEYSQYIGMPLSGLIAEADRIRRENIPARVELCSIINAKSGRCSEDCSYCAQSGYHTTGAAVYGLKSEAEIIEAAFKARDAGAERFSIVTSGNRLNDEELKRTCDITGKIIEKTGLAVCGSLGALSAGDFQKLRNAGMTRYHHNIETSREHYPNIVTTHNFQQRVDTIKSAQIAGFEICSGGILGLGESWEDRISMALLLRELKVDAVPLNILIPVKGTRIEGVEPIAAEDIIRTIAILRIILKDVSIKVIAGRESRLKDFQAMAFLAGANGMMVGGYLTVGGRSVEEDKILTSEIERMWAV